MPHLTLKSTLAMLALLIAGGTGLVAQTATPTQPSTEPVPQAPSALMTGTLYGTVTDATGALIPDATVQLSAATTTRKTTRSASDGTYTFTGVTPGSFKLDVSATSFDAATTTGTLQPGELHAVPPIALVAAASLTVEVTQTRVEMAEEEIKLEEQQRLIGIFPNFYVVFESDAVPLDAKQKMGLAYHVIRDPSNFLFAGLSAGVQQVTDSYNGFHQGASGFGKRYGAALASGSTATLLRDGVFPALFREDPRYFYRGTGSIKSRAFYALSTAFIAKGDNGKWRPSYAGITGNLASGAISNFYYAASDRNGAELTFENGALSIAGEAIGHLLQEFVFSRVTSHAKTKP